MSRLLRWELSSARGFVLVAAALACLGLSACAPATSAPPNPPAAAGEARSGPPSAASGAAPASTSPGTAPVDWSTEWERTLAAARQEGTVVVGIQTGDLYRDWAFEFEKAYPGIKLELTGQAAREMVPRVLAERQGGFYLWDVYVGGNESGFTGLKPAGALDPLRPALILPEVLDDSKWLGGFDDGFTDLEGRYMYAHRGEVGRLVYVNRDFVPESQLDRVEDLVDPRWRGRISWQDPRVNGSGAANAGHVLLVAGEDWYRRVLAQDVVTTRDQRQQVEWLVRGRYPIAVAPADEPMAAFNKEGMGLNVQPLAPDSPLGRRLALSLGMALFNRAPHPNAAKVFLNWALSTEGQRMWVRHLVNQHSRRLDVPGPADAAPDPNVEYSPSINREANNHFTQRAMDIAQEVLK